MLNDDVEAIVRGASKLVTKWKRKALETKMAASGVKGMTGLVVLNKENQEAVDSNSDSVTDGTGRKLGGMSPAAEPVPEAVAGLMVKIKSLGLQLREETEDKLTVLKVLHDEKEALLEKLNKPATQGAPTADLMAPVEQYLTELQNSTGAASEAELERKENELAEKVAATRVEKAAAVEVLQGALANMREDAQTHEIEAKHAELEKKLAENMQKMAAHHERTGRLDEMKKHHKKFEDFEKHASPKARAHITLHAEKVRASIRTLQFDDAAVASAPGPEFTITPGLAGWVSDTVVVGTDGKTTRKIMLSHNVSPEARQARTDAATVRKETIIDDDWQMIELAEIDRVVVVPWRHNMNKAGGKLLGFSIALEEDGSVVVGTLIEELKGELTDGDLVVAIGGIRLVGLSREQIGRTVRDCIGAARVADTPLELVVRSSGAELNHTNHAGHALVGKKTAAEWLEEAVNLLMGPEQLKQEDTTRGYGALWQWAQCAYTEAGCKVEEDAWLDLDVSELRKKALAAGWPKSEVEKGTAPPPLLPHLPLPAAARRAATLICPTPCARSDWFL